MDNTLWNTILQDDIFHDCNSSITAKHWKCIQNMPPKNKCAH